MIATRQGNPGGRRGSCVLLLMVLAVLQACNWQQQAPQTEVSRAAALVCESVPRGTPIVVGELHGTAEAPEFFRDLVRCRAGKAENGLVVGLELPTSALTAALAIPESATKSEARNLLASNGFWKNAKDGRTSSAMLELIHYLRRIEVKGSSRVVAFDMRKSGADNFSVLAVDAIEDSLGAFPSLGDKRPEVLLLTGNGHATMAQDEGSLGSEMAIRGLAPYIFQVRFAAGQAWVCRMGECGISDAGRGVCANSERVEVPAGAGEIGGVCISAATASEPAVDATSVN